MFMKAIQGRMKKWPKEIYRKSYNHLSHLGNSLSPVVKLDKNLDLIFSNGVRDLQIHLNLIKGSTTLSQTQITQGG